MLQEPQGAVRAKPACGKQEWAAAVPNVFHMKHLKQAGLGVIFNKAENATIDEMQLFRSTCAVLPSGSKGSLLIAGWAVHKFNQWINGYAGDKNTPGCRHTGSGPANSSSQDRMGQQCKSRLTDQPTAPSGGWQRDWRGRHRERQQDPTLNPARPEWCDSSSLVKIHFPCRIHVHLPQSLL